jgi:predicted nucleotidyltransferase
MQIARLLGMYICSIIQVETLMSTQMMSQRIAEYFKTQPVVKAWLFGSYSRNEQRPWSDVDILVQYDRSSPIGLMKIAGMKVDLEDLLNCEVDLVEEGTLRPWAVESVNRDKKLIYERA